MEQYMEGWKRREEVWIPEIEKEGFGEDVIIRQKIAPIPAEMEKQVKEPEVWEKPLEEEFDEDATVLLREEEYDGEEATVLVMVEQMPKAYLIRKKDGEETLIDKDYFVIGKSVAADLIVKDNQTVSRKHAAITRKEDGYYLEDLGSSNHTWLNEEQIEEPVRMTGGAVLKLSTEEFEFEIR